jgi:hypothetical protein|tara:strand:- start:705 stop:1079 length:375 start_codon:yes stop_codon:yes gene_type:complete
MSDLKALLGAFLYAWLPEAENPHRPGPKFRPTLVVDVDPDARKICLAYGTSQKTDRNGRGEITFASDEIDGLTKDTKFCLGTTYWIPVSAEYLCKHESANKLSVIGKIPSRRTQELLIRLQEIG